MLIPRFVYDCDDPIICMGAIDALSKHGFEFRAEHIDGKKMTASEQFIRVALYLRRNPFFYDDDSPFIKDKRAKDLDIYFAYLVEYTKDSEWRDLSEYLETKYNCSLIDIAIFKNGKMFILHPEYLEIT